MYQRHPSHLLCRLFEEKPFQGASPEEAEFVFLGIDANYSADIEHSPIFEKLLEYHQNGVAFWKKNKIHHPFLLPQYDGDGARYHKYFSKLGISPDYADKISFMELLHLPTVGRNPKLTPKDFDKKHIERIYSLISAGKKLNIFAPATTIRLLDLKRKFQFKTQKTDRFDEILTLNEVSIYKHLHFSYQYGKNTQMQNEAQGIKKLITGQL